MAPKNAKSTPVVEGTVIPAGAVVVEGTDIIPAAGSTSVSDAATESTGGASQDGGNGSTAPVAPVQAEATALDNLGAVSTDLSSSDAGSASSETSAARGQAAEAESQNSPESTASGGAGLDASSAGDADVKATSEFFGIDNVTGETVDLYVVILDGQTLSADDIRLLLDRHNEHLRSQDTSDFPDLRDFPLLYAELKLWNDTRTDFGAAPYLRIKSRIEGFMRGGIRHTLAAAEHALDKFTPAQIEAMLNEPALTVELI